MPCTRRRALSLSLSVCVCVGVCVYVCVCVYPCLCSHTPMRMPVCSVDGVDCSSSRPPGVFVVYRFPPSVSGFGFVTFEDSRDAREALEKMSGYEFNGKRIRCDLDAGVKKKQNAGYIK